MRINIYNCGNTKLEALILATNTGFSVEGAGALTMHLMGRAFKNTSLEFDTLDCGDRYVEFANIRAYWSYYCREVEDLALDTELEFNNFITQIGKEMFINVDNGVVVLDREHEC